MGPEAKTARVIHFGVFEVDLAAGQLRKSGRRVRLQEQPFQILAALLERPGKVVTREELREKLWPGDTFVEFDDGLNTAVRKIRQALGDSADNPRFIETLPRRGYRFIGPVQDLDDSSSENQVRPTAAQAVDERAASKGRVGWYVAGAAVLALVAAVAWPRLFVSSDPELPDEPMEVLPLTSYPGTERFPSLSPDGQQVAFSWNGETENNFDIYVQRIGSHTPPLRLTTNPDYDISPAWSPDGRFIAFARALDPSATQPYVVATQCEIFVTPAIGGPQRKVAETSAPEIIWLPDGQGLIGSYRQSPEEPLALFVFPINGAEKRQLTQPPVGTLGDFVRALSPNRRRVAFHRQLGIGANLLHTVDFRNDYTPRATAIPWTLPGEAWDATWSGNEHELIVVYGPSSASWSLGRLSLHEPDRLRPLGVTTLGAIDPDFSPKTNRLVFSQHTWDINLGQLRRTNANGRSWQMATFSSSTLREDSPHYSPDGKQVVFVSGRTGEESLWISDADGSAATLLHTFGSAWAGSPRWSPDGQRVAFDSPAAGTYDIYAISAAGGEPLRLTEDSAFDHLPRWSADGQWIYFTSNRSGRWEIWRISAARGEPQQVTRQGGTLALASPDGKFLYYLKAEDLPFVQHSQLWRMPVGEGKEELVLERVFSRNFAVTEEGIYFMQGLDQGQAGKLMPIEPTRFTVRYLHLTSGKVQTLVSLPAEVRPFYGFTVSPDEQTILYTRRDATGADLMLVENFR